MTSLLMSPIATTAEGQPHLGVAQYASHLSVKNLNRIKAIYETLAEAVDRYAIKGQDFIEAYRAAVFSIVGKYDDLSELLYPDILACEIERVKTDRNPYWGNILDRYGVDSPSFSQIRDNAFRTSRSISENLPELWRNHMRYRFFEKLASK